MKINVYNTEDEVLAGLANYFVDVAAKSIANHGQFSVALSGGNSPKKLYELLASPEYKNKVEWSKVHFFFGDEHYVPHTDPQSNYLMAKKAILEPLDLIVTDKFSRLIPRFLRLTLQRSIPTISTCTLRDLMPGLILYCWGWGDNSHTASLFPHTPVLHDESASVKEVYLEDQKVYRITMTAPLINQAHHIAFLVYGAGKAEAVHHILEDKKNIELYPAQLIKAADGEVQWFLDTPAASLISKK